MDKREWEGNNQSFELDFHRKDNYRWGDSFIPAWRKHFEEWCGLDDPCEFEDKVVLDLGCGSRSGVYEYFEPEGVCYYADPLIEDYSKIQEMHEHWISIPYGRQIRVPAEDVVGHLFNACWFINCWNMLDHCYDWRKVFVNLSLYIRRGGLVSFSTDTAPHTGHTGIDDVDALMRMVHASFEVVKDEPGYWGREIAMLLRRK